MTLKRGISFFTGSDPWEYILYNNRAFNQLSHISAEVRRCFY